jgi:hypothetical protein
MHLQCPDAIITDKNCVDNCLKIKDIKNIFKERIRLDSSQNFDW